MTTTTANPAGDRPTLRVVPGPPAPVPDGEEVKAVVRHEFGSLDLVGLPGPVYTRAQARNERTLQAAIRAAYDDGVTVPCLTDPATWDGDRPEVRREDIARAARLCRTACPVFDRCAAFLATQPPVCGVVAGRYVRHATDSHTNPNMKDDWAREVTGPDAA